MNKFEEAMFVFLLVCIDGYLLTGIAIGMLLMTIIYCITH